MGEEKIEKFLKENFEKIGSEACSKKLNMRNSMVHYRATKLGLKIPDDILFKIRSERGLKMNEHKSKKICDDFKKIQTPEQAYLLGFIWADGYCKRGMVSLTIAEEDMNNIKNIFMQTGEWKFTKLKKGKFSKKEILSMRIYSIKLSEIFKKMGFFEKSGASHKKVLDFIPEKLWPYWFRGYFDGDGTIFNDLKRKNTKVSISSTYEQDWSYLQHILSELGVKTSIYQNKSHYKHDEEERDCKHSILSLPNIPSIYKFFKYIYNPELKHFGLERKYERFITFINIPGRRSKILGLLKDEPLHTCM